MSLVVRIIILIAISITVNTLILIFLSLNQQKSLYESTEKLFISTLIQNLRDTLVRDVIDRNVLRTTNLLNVIKNNNPLIEFVFITDDHNNVFAHSFEKGFPRYLYNELKVHIDNHDKVLHISNKFQTETKLIYEYRQTLLPGLEYDIYIGLNQSITNAILLNNRNELIIFSISISLFLLIMALFISKKSLNPLFILSSLLNTYKEGADISFSSIDQTSPEIKQLVITLEKMIRQQDNAMKLLKNKEENLSLTLNSIGDAVIVTDFEGKVVRMNPVAEDLTGWSFNEAKELPMKTIFKIVDAKTREAMIDPAIKVLLNGRVIYLQNHTTLISKDKTEYQIADSAAPIFDNKDSITGVVVVFHDVTQQYKLREKAKGMLDQLQRTFDDISVTIILLEIDGRVIISNRALINHDENHSSIEGEILWDTKNISKDKKLQSLIKSMVSDAVSGMHREEDIIIFKEESPKWSSVKTHPVINEEGDVIQVVLEAEDITERKEAEQRISYQAHYDSLTNIPNRFLSLDRISQMIKEAKRENALFAILFFDLDNFKKINDNLGHDIGDKVLIEASKRLKEVLREKDIYGRLGGDEFIIALNDIRNLENAKTVANNLLQSFEKPFSIDDRELLLTLSIGVVLYPDNGHDVSELLINADIAMYRAKRSGRNTYICFNDNLNDNVSRQLDIEGRIPNALDDNEFTVHYQPKVRAGNGEIVGVEALLRWNNKELGFIPPDEFIPIAEKSSYILKLGYFVLTETFKNLVKWKEHITDNFCVAINLSPVQFRDPQLLTIITSEMKKYDIEAKN
ncbi:MAG TPA: diguanylate cyclase, partial [Arcobacter sp.]|nr:diguanylate cyclase [Arcobacter sp.]